MLGGGETKYASIFSKKQSKMSVQQAKDTRYLPHTGIPSIMRNIFIPRINTESLVYSVVPDL